MKSIDSDVVALARACAAASIPADLVPLSAAAALAHTTPSRLRRLQLARAVRVYRSHDAVLVSLGDVLRATAVRARLGGIARYPKTGDIDSPSRRVRRVFAS